jgi:DNA-binding response OmpR family regulator
MKADCNKRSLTGLSALVVDDETMLRRRLSAHLKALGAEVSETGNLQDSRETLTSLEFDFVLLDVNLPDGIGLDLLRDGAIPENTGVIVMTAEGGVVGLDITQSKQRKS